MRAGEPVASLPMQDWPALRRDTDRLWGALRDGLRGIGEASPERLDRTRGLMEVWTHPELVLSQSCGLPFAQHLAGRVTLIGAFDHDLPETPAGSYHSVLVVRAGDARETLAAFRNAVAAVNARGSQSGYGALAWAVAPLARDGRFFAASVETGAHLGSAQAVLEGRADIAALDAVSWRHMRRLGAVPEGLRVLLRTPPVPGLPLIARRGRDAVLLQAVVSEAVAGLDAGTRGRLGIAGFRAMEAADYAPLAALPAATLIPGEAVGSCLRA